MLRVAFSKISRQSCNVHFMQDLKGVRFLYTLDALGVDAFNQQKDRASLQLKDSPQMKEKLISRMQELLKTEHSNLMFSDDLKAMINFANGSESDVALLRDMIERFNTQGSGVKFGTFVFGPVIMRFLYSQNKPLVALELLRNPKTIGLFDQFMSYQIAMDLLLINKLYNEVIEVFDLVQGRLIQNNKYPKNCFILATAALFHMNTPESFEKLRALLKDASDVGHVPMRRSLTYSASLAIKQGHPEYALEVLASTRQRQYVTVRNLSALAYSKVGRFDEAIAILRSSLDHDSSNSSKRTICADVVKAIREEIEKSNNKEFQVEIASIEKFLTERGLIDSKPLDEFLDFPIEKVLPTENKSRWGSPQNFDRRDDSFDKNDRRPSRSFYPIRRPGLNEME